MNMYVHCFATSRGPERRERATVDVFAKKRQRMLVKIFPSAFLLSSNIFPLTFLGINVKKCQSILPQRFFLGVSLEKP